MGRLLLKPRHPDARALLDVVDPRDPRAPRARSPGGVLVVLAAQLDAPASVTAPMVGVSVGELYALVDGAPASEAVLSRLRAWVSMLWARLASLSPEAKADLLVAVWAAPVPVSRANATPTPLRPKKNLRRVASPKISPRKRKTPMAANLDVKFVAIRVWQSDPPGIAVVADAASVRVEMPGQLLVDMRVHRPDHLALVDQAACSQMTAEGPRTVLITVDQADEWARHMKLNLTVPGTGVRQVEIGPTLLDAWTAHRELHRAARATAPTLFGVS